MSDADDEDDRRVTNVDLTRQRARDALPGAFELAHGVPPAPDSYAEYSDTLASFHDTEPPPPVRGRARCDVFISYSTRDRAVADPICHGIEAAGVRCWMAPRDIPPGSNWASEIMCALEACSIVVLICSAASNRSKHVLREIERALDKDKEIIQVRIEDVTLSKAMELLRAPANGRTPPHRPSSDTPSG